MVIIALLLVIGHFFLHGLEGDDGDCVLCDLLATGFTSIGQYELLLLVLFIAIIPQIKLMRLALPARLQIQLRAPPSHSNL